MDKKNKKKPYGGISNISQYLMEKYGAKPALVKRGRPIVMNSNSMEAISGRKTRNCSVVAVTRVIDYYAQKGMVEGAPKDICQTYKLVEKIAESYGYTDKKGTIPLFISGIAKEAFMEYGVKAKCRGIYIWSFEKQVEKEISAGRPVIMNIARGFYKDHTIVVAGYSIWRVGDKLYPMLRVIDGWKSGYHYIDYEAFARDISQSIFGSFNTICLYEEKK